MLTLNSSVAQQWIGWYEDASPTLSGGDNSVVSLIKKFGSNAHLYAPGVGSVNGITAYNYVASTGAAAPDAAVDGVVGLMLDNGSTPSQLGSELVTNGSNIVNTTGWSSNNSATLSAASGYLQVTSSGASYGGGAQSFATTVGTAYVLSFVGRRGTADIAWYLIGNSIGSNTLATQNITGTTDAQYTYYFTATATTTWITFQNNNVVSGATCFAGNISCKPCYGLPAAQPTTASKPTLRRGAVNLLTYSNTFSDASWQKTTCSITATNITAPDGTATASAITSSGADASLAHGFTPVASTPYTDAYWLKVPTGTLTLNLYMNGGGILQSTAANLTTTWQLFVVNGTPSTTANMLAQVGGGSTWGNGQVVHIAYAGRFLGSLTSAQILANGGIPMTTTAAASQSAGPWWGEFDGTNDQFALSALPFTQADDHAVVMVVRADSVAGIQALFSVTGVSTQRVAQIYRNGTAFNINWQDDGAGTVAFSTTIALGEYAIVTAWKSGTSYVARKNGTQFGSSTQTLGATTLTSCAIGQSGGFFWKGLIGQTVLIKGTVTTDQLLTLERALGQQYGITTA